MANDSNMGTLVIIGVALFGLGYCTGGDEPEPIELSASAQYGETEPQGLAHFSAAEDATEVQTFAPPIDVEPEPYVEPEPAPVARSVYYRNCSAARAAGAAPVYAGDAGYAPHLDRDGDGIGCE